MSRKVYLKIHSSFSTKNFFYYKLSKNFVLKIIRNYWVFIVVVLNLTFENKIIIIKNQNYFSLKHFLLQALYIKNI
jgi:hypothetical protein